jgi:L-2-amino-thiazoline-4-carboxylic acid hydrolase
VPDEPYQYARMTRMATSPLVDSRPAQAANPDRPGYRFDDVAENDGRSLNMVRCPVADYLGQRDAADLCAGSWCNLDYALAEMWGGRLQRSSTPVAGADCCDFSFHALPVSDEHPELAGE